jgi:phosphopantetheine--protein transferase-like protein
MILGIGVDILHIARFCNVLAAGDFFIRKVYTENERRQAKGRSLPMMYYATRFAGKEAVFKCFGANGEQAGFSDIEILEEEHGRPVVLLHDAVMCLAEQKGIARVEVSLSYETEYVAAFAVAHDGH